jgi:hypothetical protein
MHLLIGAWSLVTPEVPCFGFGFCNLANFTMHGIVFESTSWQPHHCTHLKITRTAIDSHPLAIQKHI